MTRTEKRELKDKAQLVETLQYEGDSLLKENRELNEVVMARNIRHAEDEATIRDLHKKIEATQEEVFALRRAARITGDGMEIERAELQARADRLEMRIKGLA